MRVVVLQLAEATILRFILRLHHALESWEQTAIEKRAHELFL